jgi:hypothetical protein
MTKLRISTLALVAAALLGAGCGGEKTDISQGVDRLNSDLLEPQGVRMDCPDEIDGGEGATFDCTMKSTKGDASAPVKMKIVKEEGDLAVDIADEKQFDAALKKVVQ